MTQLPPPPPMVGPAPAGRRRTGLLVLGLILLAGGVAAIVAGLLVGNARYDDAVKKLARAPAGCTTTLQFDETGTYTLYVETKGRVGTLSGDCADAGEYDHAGGPPAIETLSLTSADGAEVTLGDSGEKSYDAAGAKGTALHEVTIETPGTYELTVKSADTDFAVAIGKDPKGDAEETRNLGIGGGVMLAVLGIVLSLLGRQRRGPARPSRPAWVQPAQPYSSATWPPASPQMPPPPPPAMPPPPSGWDVPRDL